MSHLLILPSVREGGWSARITSFQQHSRFPLDFDGAQCPVHITGPVRDVYSGKVLGAALQDEKILLLAYHITLFLRARECGFLFRIH